MRRLVFLVKKAAEKLCGKEAEIFETGNFASAPVFTGKLRGKFPQDVTGKIF